MSSTHTPGLAEVHCPDSDCPGISTPGNREGIATTYGIYASVKTKQANARRLVACWNALDGVSTEEIESGIEITSRTAVNELAARIQTLVDALAKTETYLLERVSSNPGSTGATVILPMIRRALEGSGVAPTQSTWADC